eukprot:1349009-Amphidinium_carterae.2
MGREVPHSITSNHGMGAFQAVPLPDEAPAYELASGLAALALASADAVTNCRAGVLPTGKDLTKLLATVPVAPNSRSTCMSKEIGKHVILVRPRVREPGGRAASKAGRAPPCCCRGAFPVLPFFSALGLHSCFRSVLRLRHLPLYVVTYEFRSQ